MITRTAAGKLGYQVRVVPVDDSSEAYRQAAVLALDLEAQVRDGLRSEYKPGPGTDGRSGRE